MKVTLEIWRQPDTASPGRFESYPVDDAASSSPLPVLDWKSFEQTSYPLTITALIHDLLAFAEALPVLPIRLAAPVTPGRPDPANAPAVIASIEQATKLGAPIVPQAVDPVPRGRHAPGAWTRPAPANR